MNSKKIWSLGALLLLTVSLKAQIVDNSHLVNLKEVLPYVYIFYGLTFLALSLLIMKLLKPQMKTYFLYAACILGILGAVFTNQAFNRVQEEQLPEVAGSEIPKEEMSDYSRQMVEKQEREVEQQKMANFWIIAIPNIIMLGLGVVIDIKARQSGNDGQLRGRYDGM
ncbi:hypothetical protein [Saprospira grandis]|uniref:Uncharacterized protein n=1 Tax=Saprospira grandis (strain Lewin) TaxID=984262 RepID=H6L7T3_SAPGL|nr:hypothetical protein [Saprospira grandis]AFC24154.1 hypothetical protein SGRA_1419 [Saprospira grandis str. Lewin]